jgi:hypothetical protein
MTWLYNGVEVSDDMIPEGSIGFIYLIRCKKTDRLYIGRKMLTKAATKMVAGKKKKIRAESDWKDYWSSSPELKKIIKEQGNENFTREILMFVKTKGALSYAEENLLHHYGALETTKWFNSNIRAKIYRTWVTADAVKELNRVKSQFVL